MTFLSCESPLYQTCWCFCGFFNIRPQRTRWIIRPRRTSAWIRKSYRLSSRGIVNGSSYAKMVVTVGPVSRCVLPAPPRDCFFNNPSRLRILVSCDARLRETLFWCITKHSSLPSGLTLILLVDKTKVMLGVGRVFLDSVQSTAVGA